VAPVPPAIARGPSEVLHTDEAAQASAIRCTFSAPKYGKNLKQEKEEPKLAARHTCYESQQLPDRGAPVHCHPPGRHHSKEGGTLELEGGWFQGSGLTVRRALHGCTVLPVASSSLLAILLKEAPLE